MSDRGYIGHSIMIHVEAIKARIEGMKSENAKRIRDGAEPYPETDFYALEDKLMECAEQMLALSRMGQ